jgi:hypothetical protein
MHLSRNMTEVAVRRFSRKALLFLLMFVALPTEILLPPSVSALPAQTASKNRKKAKRKVKKLKILKGHHGKRRPKPA